MASDPSAPHHSPHADYYDTVDAINSSERSADEFDFSIKSDHAQDVYDETIETFEHSVRSDYGFDHHEYVDCHENECTSIEPQQNRVDRSCDVSTESSKRVSSHYESAQSYASTSDQSAYYESEHSEYASESEQYDETDFPPGHITTLSEMEALQTRRKSTGSFNSSANSDNLNPSILPTYFFCPLTKCIMKDPVLTPDGNTYERLAIIRYLVLDPSDPSTGSPLTIEELRQDQMVKDKIEKCRREAWMRYVMEANRGGVNRFMEAEDRQSQYESSRAESEDDTSDLNTTNDSVDELDDSGYSRESENLVLVNTSSSEEPRYDQFYHASNQNANLLKSNFKGILPANNVMQVRTDTSVTSIQPATANIHGWNTPLGVHRIICKPPGLVVTADVHRRSAVVKRKVVKQKLVTKNNKKKRREQVDFMENQSTPERGRNMIAHISTKKKKDRTILVATSQDLVLPPGSHVEIVETVVHGGRVRGKILWEEEMIVELDDELLDQMKKTEGVGVSFSASNSKKKNKPFFRSKNSQQGKNPFSSDLFTESPYQENATKKGSPSPPSLTLVKYSGWISLEWAGPNREREEAAARIRNGTGMSDEDYGPWSQPLQLGVYRVAGDRLSGYIHPGSTSLAQLPLSDAPNSDRNISYILVNKQCIEIVEIQVVVMTTKIAKGIGNHHYGINASGGFFGVRTVRARCMVPIVIPPMIPEHVDGMRCINARPQKKFKSGWISLYTDESLSKESNAAPLPSGAYIVTSNVGCTVTEGTRTDSKIKSVLPCNSCVEVVTTRMEFEDNEEMIKCHCGRESMYSVVAVRALLASGGHLTLFFFPISTLGSVDNVCYCGQFVQHTLAEPVPIGMYKITSPGGVVVTAAIGQGSSTITTIQQGVCLKVLQTGVEDGCVRGRVCLNYDNQPVVGWISLFKFPDQRWAQYFLLEE